MLTRPIINAILIVKVVYRIWHWLNSFVYLYNGFRGYVGTKVVNCIFTQTIKMLHVKISRYACIVQEAMGIDWQIYSRYVVAQKAEEEANRITVTRKWKS